MFCLSDDEIFMVDGGGEERAGYSGRPSSSYSGGSIGYGGQANGFQPNSGANGLFSGGCSTVVGSAVTSVAIGAARGGWAGAMAAAGASAVGVAAACGHN
ncbi:hypothetical protein L4D77_28510 [Photobacterium frigidiphilum]|uniref:hypothetical protein n=1 Tax=Photobacterium frigidiphilum TaxID=264736 RepID=UPI003D11CA24